MKNNKHRFTPEDLIKVVPNCMCWSDVCRALGLRVHGANYKSIKIMIQSESIDVSHFSTVDAYNRRGLKKARTEDNVFCEKSTVPRGALNYYAKRFRIMEQCCAECSITGTYNNKPISLQLDHINGIVDDNRKVNLRWLCPNCHSQTDNYCGKAHKK